MTEAEELCERLARTSKTVLAMVRKLAELDGQPHAATLEYEGCENIRQAAAMIAAQAGEIVRLKAEVRAKKALADDHFRNVRALSERLASQTLTQNRGKMAGLSNVSDDQDGPRRGPTWYSNPLYVPKTIRQADGDDAALLVDLNRAGMDGFVSQGGPRCSKQ